MDAQAAEDQKTIYFCLLPARDDPKYRDALGDFLHALSSQNIEVSPRYYANDAVGGGCGLSGEFGLIASAVGPALCTAVGAFLVARYGRKARLKIGLDGKVEAEAQTVEEVEKLIKIAQKHLETKSRK
jgi:hypothetical protein